MSLLKHLSIGMVLFGVLTGCGQTTVETVMVPNGESPTARGKGMTAVILPFADYSDGDNIASAFRRHLLVTQSVTDNLVGNGFGSPVPEDVFKYLVEQKIISAERYDEKDFGMSSLAGELADSDWSDVMKDKLKHYMAQQQMQQNEKKNLAVGSPGTHGLTSQEVVKIGRKFGADYVLRGQILEFRTRQEHSWDPRKRGILPFVAGTTNRVAFGFADSTKYDSLGNTVAGGLWGGIAGNNANGPWDPESSTSFFGISGGKDANVIAWAVAGSELGKMTNHGGRTDQAVVQMRIWVQSAYDASIVWTNRADVRVAPESVLADNQYDDLFEQAIRKATSALLEDFVVNGIPKQ